MFSWSMLKRRRMPSIALTPFAELGNEMASVFTTISNSASSANTRFIKNGRLPSLARMYVLTACDGVHMRAICNRWVGGKQTCPSQKAILARRHRPHPLGGKIIGRKERLQRQFRQRDIDRRAEDHGGGNKAQHVAIEPHLEGDRDAVGGQRRRSRRHRIGFQLMIEPYQLGIGGRLALAGHPPPGRGPPFR